MNARPDERPQAPGTQDAPAAQEPAPALPPRVLIVDDHPLNVELARFLLEADGWAVEAAGDGLSGLARIEQGGLDAVLMDIQLPGLDGLSLTQRLRAQPAHDRLAIIAFTAYAMQGDEARMRAAGCDSYVSKPIEVRRFTATIREALAQAQARVPRSPPP